MDENLDDALEAAARAEGTSKAALIRQAVAARYKPLPSIHDDPLTSFMGASDDEPTDDIDAVIYDR